MWGGSGWGTNLNTQATKRLAGCVALVTGASRGLGAAVARRFAAEGAHVVALARSQGGLAELDDAIKGDGNEAPTLVALDLAEHDAIDRMGAALYQRFSRLDILVGNAALLGTLSPAGHIKPEDWNQVMAVNLTANWRLIRSFDGLLRNSSAGRAIFVTCAQGRDAPYWGAYAASKAGLESVVRGWADEVANVSNLRVNLVDPGPMRTRIRARAFPGEDPNSQPAPETRTDLFVDLASVECARSGELVTL